MEQKQRHGCVTAWLILIIVLNSLTALLYLLAGDYIQQNLPTEIPTYMMILLAVLAILNVLFAILLFTWKKIGFWGFIITSIAAVVINLSLNLGIAQSLIGLLGVVILWAVLQIKQNEVSAWKNLE
jgi:membrane-associated HD superfamily phosphohydrolase